MPTSYYSISHQYLADHLIYLSSSSSMGDGAMGSGATGYDDDDDDDGDGLNQKEDDGER